MYLFKETNYICIYIYFFFVLAQPILPCLKEFHLSIKGMNTWCNIVIS